MRSRHKPGRVGDSRGSRFNPTPFSSAERIKLCSCGAGDKSYIYHRHGCPIYHYEKPDHP